MSINRQKRLYLAIFVGIAVFVLYLAWPLEDPFSGGYSRCVYDCRGKLLRATLAPDGQVRFAPSHSVVPDKYRAALLTWEDRRFFLHPGVDPVSIAAAFLNNLHRGKRLRGGSTITMQLVRLAHPNRRTYFRKLVESGTALRYSCHIAKERQLSLYAAQVPMGGNVVGIESAAWRYYGAPLTELTWAQAALFVVLPNAPSAINIENKRGALIAKRNRLLKILLTNEAFDTLTCSAACAEPLPEPVSRLPFRAPHFCGYVLDHTMRSTVSTTLDLSMQERAEAIMKPFELRLAQQGIRNCAMLMCDTKHGTVKAYIGSQSFFDTTAAGQVDGIQAYRSPGSLLKPFLVACALDRGLIAMESMLHDVPTYFGNFAPNNASREFCGVTTVRQMLVKSLNVPAVRLLHAYSVEDFYSFLKEQAGMQRLFRTSGGYGLTLVLGGIETSMWELCGMFTALANSGQKTPLRFDADAIPAAPRTLISPGAAWLTLDALSDVKRPEAEFYRQFFSEQLPVSWKTGTSYGQKDAWAIGCNAQLTIGVWVGNFSGEGNALIGGAQSAGPILFSLLRNFTDPDKPARFEKQEYDLKRVEVCSASGFLPTGTCPKRVFVYLPSCATLKKQCPLHRRFCLSKRDGCEVCSRCWDLGDTIWRVKTVYDPSVVAMLRIRGADFDTVPLHNARCAGVHASSDVTIEYPVDGLVLQVPRNFSGAFEKVVFKAGCQRRDGRLFWFVNKNYLGETVGEHRLAVDLAPGEYRLTVQDQEGSHASVGFGIRKRSGG